jgi:hypothetical protein
VAWGWAAAAALLAGVIGAYAGWRVGASVLPTNSELRTAAASLAPQRFRLEGVSLVDRGPSLSRPLWDVGGSRYAQADLRVPATVDSSAVQAAIATKARNGGWRRAGATSYERDATKATVEITELGPAASDVEVAIRVRPHSKRPQLGLAIGFAAGVLAALFVVLVVGLVRPPARGALR